MYLIKEEYDYLRMCSLNDWYTELVGSLIHKNDSSSKFCNNFEPKNLLYQDCCPRRKRCDGQANHPLYAIDVLNYIILLIIKYSLKLI